MAENRCRKDSLDVLDYPFLYEGMSSQVSA